VAPREMPKFLPHLHSVGCNPRQAFDYCTVCVVRYISGLALVRSRLGAPRRRDASPGGCPGTLPDWRHAVHRIAGESPILFSRNRSNCRPASEPWSECRRSWPRQHRQGWRRLVSTRIKQKKGDDNVLRTVNAGGWWGSHPLLQLWLTIDGLPIFPG